ncbi:MAG TPA: GFA family protein [Kiritimatiellia bacterium]|jgi:hypothetical protein
MLIGSCHCGAVKYEAPGKVLRFSYCHCDDCRKITGGPFGAAIVAQASGFRVTAGEPELTAYASSPGKARNFCRRCGTHLFSKMDSAPDIVIIRAGTVEGDHGLKPQMHIWVSAKAAWDDIRDDLPQHAEWPPKK